MFFKPWPHRPARLFQRQGAACLHVGGNQGGRLQVGNERLFLGGTFAYVARTQRGESLLTRLEVIVDIAEEARLVHFEHETVDCRGVMETLITVNPHRDFRAVGLRYGDRTRISLYGIGVLRHTQQQAQAHQKFFQNFHVLNV